MGSFALFQLGLAVAGACAYAQTVTPELSPVQRRHREYPALAAVVDLAATAPVEPRALALTRVGSDRSIHDAAWKEELL